MDIKNPELESVKDKLEQQIPQEEHKYDEIHAAFIAVLEDKSHTIQIGCTADLRRHRLDRKYDAVFVLNEAYFRARKAIDAKKTIYNYPGWIRLTCTRVVQELSRAEQKKNKLNRQLFHDMASAPEPANWLEEEEATPEQLGIRQAFGILSPLEQDILKLKVVKSMRWKDIQPALVAAGHAEMTTNHLSQLKRRALKKLKNNYQAISG